MRLRAFLELGEALGALPDDVVARAAAANGWFTERDIRRAAAAVASRMLNEEALKEWLPEPFTRARVGVIMAGNIPLVGLHDMLCVLAAGGECLYKPSAKDAVLMDFAAENLARTLPVRRWAGEEVDAVIATGGDNARRLFAGRFAGLPVLLRGNRGSVAVLDGHETEEQLTALAGDIFSYSGLGCRNVSRLFLPAGYDMERLVAIFNEYGAPSEKYRNNFLQRRALLSMQGAAFVEGGFFVLREGTEFPEYISEIVYDFGDAGPWLAAHEGQVQCVVGRGGGFGIGSGIGFGEAQQPGLTDYADGVDTMAFLARGASAHDKIIH
jgi:hypothetical protein